MDIATAQEHLDAWLTADQAVAKGQSYTIGDRQLTRTDARVIRDRITYWQRVVNTLTAEAAGQSAPAVKIAVWNPTK